MRGEGRGREEGEGEGEESRKEDERGGKGREGEGGEEGNFNTGKQYQDPTHFLYDVTVLAIEGDGLFKADLSAGGVLSNVPLHATLEVPLHGMEFDAIAQPPVHSHLLDSACPG